MSCEECAKSTTAIQESIDAIRVSQVQTQENVQWLVETVQQLATGFQNMINEGGVLGMIKQLRGAKKNG